MLDLIYVRPEASNPRAASRAGAGLTGTFLPFSYRGILGNPNNLPGLDPGRLQRQQQPQSRGLYAGFTSNQQAAAAPAANASQGQCQATPPYKERGRQSAPAGGFRDGSGMSICLDTTSDVSCAATYCAAVRTNDLFFIFSNL